jgi:hypothetical protein
VAIAFTTSASEHDLGAELQNPAWSGRYDRAKGCSVIRIVVHWSANAGAGERIISILVMIEHVEGFRSELESCPFSQLEVLAKSQVPVVDTRSTDDVASAVSELAGKRLNKGRGIEPLRDAVLAASRANLIATLGKTQQESEVVVAKN